MSKSTNVDFEEDELDDYIYEMGNLDKYNEEMDDYIYEIDELQRNSDLEDKQNNNSKEKEEEESLDDYIFDLEEENRRSQLPKFKITLTRTQMIKTLIDKCQFTIEKAEWITNTLQCSITEEC